MYLCQMLIVDRGKYTSFSLLCFFFLPLLSSLTCDMCVIGDWAHILHHPPSMSISVVVFFLTSKKTVLIPRLYHTCIRTAHFIFIDDKTLLVLVATQEEKNRQNWILLEKRKCWSFCFGFSLQALFGSCSWFKHDLFFSAPKTAQI